MACEEIITCGTEKPWKDYDAIEARYVTFQGENVNEPSDVCYYEVAEKQVGKNSLHHHFGYRQGKLTDNYFTDSSETCTSKKGVLIFKISLKSDDTAIISGNNKVARPCPPFCHGSGFSFKRLFYKLFNQNHIKLVK